MEVHYIKGHGVEYLERQLLALALVPAIVGAALVSLREQEGNIEETENKIWWDFFNFDERTFPSPSGILRNVTNHLELEF